VNYTWKTTGGGGGGGGRTIKDFFGGGNKLIIIIRVHICYPCLTSQLSLNKLNAHPVEGDGLLGHDSWVPWHLGRVIY
jgi:hypothetical protein